MVNNNSTHWADTTELVEQYIQKRIAEDEWKKLEIHLKECTYCAEIVQKERELIAGICLFGRSELKKRLARRLAKENRGMVQRYVIGFAAAVVSLFLAIEVYKVWIGPQTQFPKKFGMTEYVFKESPLPTPSENKWKDIESEKKQNSNPAAQKPTETELRQKEIITKEVSSGEKLGDEKIKDKEVSFIEKAEVEEFTPKTIWLIGHIIPISGKNKVGDRSLSENSERDGAGGEIQNQSMTTKKQDVALSSKQSLRREQNYNKGTVKVNGISQNIELIQRSANTLSSPQKENVNTIKTLMEENADGFTLTLYPDSLIDESELANAVIETVTEDSLIVHLSNQSIVYRIPSEWNIPQQRFKSTKSKNSQ